MVKFPNVFSIMFLTRVYISKFLGATNSNPLVIKGILILFVSFDESPSIQLEPLAHSQRSQVSQRYRMTMTNTSMAWESAQKALVGDFSLMGMILTGIIWHLVLADVGNHCVLIWHR